MKWKAKIKGSKEIVLIEVYKILPLGAQRLYYALNSQYMQFAIWFVCLSKMQSYRREIQFQGMRSVHMPFGERRELHINMLKKFIKPLIVLTYPGFINFLLKTVLRFDVYQNTYL